MPQVSCKCDFLLASLLFILEVSWLWKQWVCRFFSAKVLIKIAQKCLSSISISMLDCKQTEPSFTVCLYWWEKSTLNKTFPKYFFGNTLANWRGLWDLVIFSSGNWKWDLMQIVALKFVVQPYKIGVEFTTGKIFHCLEVGLSFARENYIAHLLPKFISTSLFILITFVNVLVLLSVNSSMLAFDEKKAGVGIADLCLIYLQKASVFLNSFLRRSFQCHLPFQCALTYPLLFFCLTPSHHFSLNLLNVLYCTV